MNISDITIDCGGGTIILPTRAAELDGTLLRVLVRLAADGRLRASYSDAADGAARELGLDRTALDRTVTELAAGGFLACSVKFGGEPVSTTADTAASGAGTVPKPDGRALSDPGNSSSSAPETAAKCAAKSAVAGSPDYSGTELAELLERDDGRYGQLIDECQRTLGRIFTGSETSKLVALCDFMGLEPEYVLLACAYCAGKGKNSVRYVERTACSMVEEGVDDAVKLEAYIKQKERYDSLEFKLRDMLGFGNRATTKKEAEFFKRWVDEWKFGIDIISRAYEITVKYTDRAALPYMNKILAGWHENGFTTLEQLDFAEEKRKVEKSASTGETASSFDTDEFFELALKRSYAKLSVGEAPTGQNEKTGT